MRWLHRTEYNVESNCSTGNVQLYVDMLRCVVVDGPVGHTSVHCDRGPRAGGSGECAHLCFHSQWVRDELVETVEQPSHLMKARGLKASVASYGSSVSPPTTRVSNERLHAAGAPLGSTFSESAAASTIQTPAAAVDDGAAPIRK